MFHAEREIKSERFPAQIYVAMMLTHGRSGRLLLVSNQINPNTVLYGPIAGGVEKGEIPWQAALREAEEEAGISKENIIFVKNRNNLDPYIAFINQESKNAIGLIYDVTYSGPKVPQSGWRISGDSKVKFARFFTWQEILNLLENSENIYHPEFNIPNLLRWTIQNMDKSQTRLTKTHEWLSINKSVYPGLAYSEHSWKYTPSYDNWKKSKHIHGDPRNTNFARKRFLNE